MTQLTRRHLGFAVGLLATSSCVSPVRAQTLSADELIAHLNPEFRSMIGPALPGLMRTPPMSAANLQERRNVRSNPFSKPPLATPAYTRRMIAGPAGAPDVDVYIVNAQAAASNRPAILHIHGGGYITGRAESSLRDLQELTAELNCVAVSVDYRLAPETPFPGSLEDNYAALKWLYANAEEIGVDRTRIAVMGESAGGGHAAMLAIAARDRGEVPIAFQMLIYPMLDDRTGSTRQPSQPYIGAMIWRPADNRFGWSSLLGVPAGSRRVPAGAVPARVENLRGLPPTFIGVGSIDLFVDEDIEYAQRLVAAGVLTELVVVPGGFHGFDFLETTNVVRHFKASVVAALRAGLNA